MRSKGFLKKELEKRKKEGSYRTLKVREGLIDFTSNDYLGFSRHSQEYEELTPRSGEATGSRLLAKNKDFFHRLEKLIADFHHFPSALIFNSAYHANLSLLSSVVEEGDFIFYDARIHPSTVDALKLSGAISFPFFHNSRDHLEKRLKSRKKKEEEGNIFVYVESIYSMDGSVAPLEELLSLCEEFEAHLIVDEAHALGVIGEEGKGLVHFLELQEQVFAQVVTFGKALGAFGAAVLGNEELKEYLVDFSRSFVFTTALPIPFLEKIEEGYQRLVGQEGKEARVVLEKNIDFYRKRIAELPIEPSLNPFHPIQPIQMGRRGEVIEVSKFLEKRGFDVRAILAPTVRRKEECLRLCIHSFNSFAEIDRLVDALALFLGKE